MEQVYLRCAEGSLEWLYPTGAIIVNLRPNLQTSARAGERLHACVKPGVDSRGAALYVERAGELRPLLSEAEQAGGHARCFSLQEGALFVEASAQQDISKRITAFQYQLISTQRTGDELYSPTGVHGYENYTFHDWKFMFLRLTVYRTNKYYILHKKKSHIF